MPLLFAPGGVLLIVGLLPWSAVGDGATVAAPSVTAEIRLGYAGYVVPDVWMPVTAVLRSDRDLQGTLEVAAPHPRSSSAARVRVEVHLAASVPRAVTLPAVIRDLRAPIVVHLIEAGRPVADWRAAVPPSRVVDAIILTLSDRPVGLERLLPTESRIRIAYVGPETLPVRWQLYEGVQAVVVHTLDDRRVTPTQLEALSGWVAAGGHLILVVPPGSDLLTRASLRAFLQRDPQAPAPPSAPERMHPWGRGAVTIVPVDPFRPDLSPEGAAVWRRVLGRETPAPLVERTLLDALPQRGGASALVQLLIVLTLGGYLVALRPLTAWLRRGRGGVVLSLALLGAVTAAAVALAAVARTQMTTLIQGVVAEGLLQRDLARVEALGRVVLPQGGTFALRTSGETLVRPLGEADTSLRLGGAVELDGRAAATLSVQGSALISLPVQGSIREQGEEVTVEIRNRTGRPLRDPVVVHNGRIQPIAVVGAEARVTLAPEAWRDPPPLEVARGTRARLLAWTFGRLRAGAIIDPTIDATAFLVAWLEEERGVLRWRGPPAPLLLVVPLIGMGDSP